MFDNIKDRGYERAVKRHVISQDRTFFAVVQPGFEHTAAAELKGLGFSVLDEFIGGGVEFLGRVTEGYRACVSSRTVSAVMMRLESFSSFEYRILERKIARFPWEHYLFKDSPLRFKCTAEKSMIFHTGKLEGIFSNAIRSRLAEHGFDSAGGMTDAVQTIHVRNVRDLASVSISVSGSELYKRGMRSQVSDAPMRETLASLILHEARVKDYDMIIDPMCGSGTFSLEAAGILTGTPPADERDFPFMNWPCFKSPAFENMKKKLRENIASDTVKDVEFITIDTDAHAVKAAQENCLLYSGLIEPRQGDFFDLDASVCEGRKALVVINPPYGKRLSGGGGSFFKQIGEKLQGDFSACAYAVIVPGPDKEKSFGISHDRKVLFMNGGIPAAVLFRDA